MSFDFNTLITDRSQADVSRAKDILVRANAGTATPEELDELYSGQLKGLYDFTDLNRVTASMENIENKFKEYGYKTGYKPITIGGSKDTLLLLHGEEILDSSIYSVGIQNYGVVPSETQKKFGTKSLYFDGNSKLQILNNSIIPRNGDFTIDWWEYRTESVYGGAVFNQTNVSQGSYGLLLGHSGGKVSNLYVSSDGVRWNLSGYGGFGNQKLNSWVHLALVRKGAKFLCFRDGKKVNQYDFNGTILVSQNPYIGMYDYLEGSYFAGYIDEFRISSVARWDTDFTPSNSPYQAHKSKWDENLIPTKSTMEQYLSNINKLKAQITLLKTTPSSPVSMQLLDWVGANNIEQILLDIEKQLITMASTFVACGPATCGGDYL